MDKLGTESCSIQVNLIVIFSTLIVSCFASYSFHGTTNISLRHRWTCQTLTLFECQIFQQTSTPSQDFPRFRGWRKCLKTRSKNFWLHSKINIPYFGRVCYCFEKEKNGNNENSWYKAFWVFNWIFKLLFSEKTRRDSISTSCKFLSFYDGKNDVSLLKSRENWGMTALKNGETVKLYIETWCSIESFDKTKNDDQWEFSHE